MPPCFANWKHTPLKHYQNKKDCLSKLVSAQSGFKNQVVQQDDLKKAIGKLLNFGHTLAHAIENMYELSHGQAVSIGMTTLVYL